MTLHFSIFAQTSTREMSSDESPSAPPPLELLPGNKPSDVGRGKHSAHQLVANQTALYKEYIIAVEEIKMMQVRHSLSQTQRAAANELSLARAHHSTTSRPHARSHAPCQQTLADDAHTRAPHPRRVRSSSVCRNMASMRRRSAAKCATDSGRRSTRPTMARPARRRAHRATWPSRGGRPRLEPFGRALLPTPAMARTAGRTVGRSVR